MKHLCGDSVPLTLRPRLSRSSASDRRRRRTRDPGAEGQGWGSRCGKGLGAVPAVPEQGCECRSLTKRRCQLTLGRGRRTAEPAKSCPEQLSCCCCQVSTILLLFLPGRGKVLCRAPPGWSTQHLPQRDAVTPGCASAPRSRQRGVGPVTHGAWLGAGPGAGSGLLLPVSHRRAKGSGSPVTTIRFPEPACTRPAACAGGAGSTQRPGLCNQRFPALRAPWVC